MINRIDKVNSLIQKEVAQLLRDYISLRRGTLVTVTRVETSIDLYYTTVYISALPKSQQGNVLNELNANIASIQRELNRKLVMKYVPQLRFRIDEAEALQAEVDRIFHEEIGEQSKKTDHETLDEAQEKDEPRE